VTILVAKFRTVISWNKIPIECKYALVVFSIRVRSDALLLFPPQSDCRTLHETVDCY
jgi:hypothetical protein